MKNKKLKLIALAGVTVTTAVMLTGCGNNDVKTYDKDQMNVNIAEMTEQNVVVEDDNNKVESNNKTSTNDVKKEEQTSNSNNNKNNVSVDKDKVANEAIKKALKDKKWIEENILNEGDLENYSVISGQYLKFAKIHSIDENPAYIVRYIMPYAGDKAVIVTYKDEQVIAREIPGGDYVYIKADLNNNVFEVTPDSEGPSKTYQFNNNNFAEIASYENFLVQEEYQDIYKINYEVVSKEKYDDFMKNYNFVEINTELTSENIDKYVK